MDKKESSSKLRNGLIVTAVYFAIGAILTFLEGKRKNKSSTKSQSQAQPTEETSTA